MTLGELIRENRLRKGMSMQQLADAVGCSKSQIHDIEHDISSNPSKRILNGFMNNLGIPAQTLLEAD